jgi:type VI secretion system secreted protein VgrG
MTTRAHRPASFSLRVASGDQLDVRQFTTREQLSTLFSVSVTVVADNADIDFEALIGQPAEFTALGGVATEQSRLWTGICKEVQEIAAEETGLSTYVIEIVPVLWLASQRRNHRMFQLMSEVEIALQILSEWGIEPVQKLSAVYKKRKYRVQYAESDYAFLCRMLEDAGISFYFATEGAETRMVLADTPQNNEVRDPKIRFRDNPGASDLEHVTALRIVRQVRPGRYTLRDHDYRRPAGFKLLASATQAAGVEQQLEQYHYAPGAFLYENDKGEASPTADDKGRYRTDDVEATGIARRRLDVKRSEATSFTFQSNAIDLAPGMVIGVAEHPRQDLGDGRSLLILSSTMTCVVGKAWSIQCEARRADISFRPALATPKPKVNGVESATVVGPSGEEIHTDEFGRIRVHFHWDRESEMNENSSCWIHVSQPWGGAGYGGVNLPRVGQEVLVDFLGGDPDRPVVVGRVYTNLQKVPYKLPGSKTQSGWKSNSTNATGGYNELMFEDAAGSELLRMQAEKDMHTLVKNDQRESVVRDRTRDVGRNESAMIGKNLTKQVTGNERETTGLNRSITVGVNRTAQIGSKDVTMVGTTHLVMITPPGESGPSTSSSIMMTDKKIVLDTGAGARITLDHDKIIIEADDLVEIHGKKRGVNVHASAPGGGVGIFTGKSFTVNTTKVDIFGEDTVIGGTTTTLGGGTLHILGGDATNISGGVVQINGPGFPCGRVGDPVGGTILKGAPTVFVGGGPASTLGKPADDLIAKSATLTKNLNELEADGWKVEIGKEGGGSYTDRGSKTIVLDPSQVASPEQMVQTLAHESGHAKYTIEPEVPMTGLTKQQYVDANTNRELKDEGEATLTNAKVREEIQKNGGPDIGIAGNQAKYDEIYKKYPDPADRDKARQEVGDAFADGEHPSTDPSKTYKQYYAKQFEDGWDNSHPGSKP